MAWYPSWMPFWVPCCPCCAWPNRTTWSGSSLLVRTSLMCIFETLTHSSIFILLKNFWDMTSSYSTPNTFNCERKSFVSTWLSRCYFPNNPFSSALSLSLQLCVISVTVSWSTSPTWTRLQIPQSEKIHSPVKSMLLLTSSSITGYKAGRLRWGPSTAPQTSLREAASVGGLWQESLRFGYEDNEGGPKLGLKKSFIMMFSFWFPNQWSSMLTTNISAIASICSSTNVQVLVCVLMKSNYVTSMPSCSIREGRGPIRANYCVHLQVILWLNVCFNHISFSFYCPFFPHMKRTVLTWT